MNTGTQATVADFAQRVNHQDDRVDNLTLYLDSFERHLRLRNRAPRTIDSYRDAAEAFIRFLGSRGMPLEGARLRREHVEAYIEHCQATLKPATVAHRYRSLQQFFNYLCDEGECAASPMARMHVPAVPEQTVPVLSDGDFAALLGVVSGTRVTDRRDAAILQMFWATGMRLSELASLRVEDLDMRRGTAYIELGKGRKPRSAPFGDKAAQALSRYLRLRAKHPKAKGTDRLWLAPKGPMTDSGIRQMVWSRSVEAGLKERVHPHQFRHTFAHRWLMAGGEETDLMRLTGWASRQMLSRYGASAGSERAIAAYQRLAERGVI